MARHSRGRHHGHHRSHEEARGRHHGRRHHNREDLPVGQRFVKTLGLGALGGVIAAVGAYGADRLAEKLHTGPVIKAGAKFLGGAAVATGLAMIKEVPLVVPAAIAIGTGAVAANDGVEIYRARQLAAGGPTLPSQGVFAPAGAPSDGFVAMDQAACYR